jgi:hypothetical protein
VTTVTPVIRWGLFQCGECDNVFADELPNYVDDFWPKCPHGCIPEDDPLTCVTTPTNCSTWTLPCDSFRPRLLEPLIPSLS